MLTPICSECAKSGSVETLCSACAAKLSSGQISEQDIAVSNFLHTCYPELDVEFLYSFSTQKYLVLFMRGKVARIIGDGSNISAIEKRVNRRIKIINVDHDIKKIISDLIYPATLIGINTLFSDGEERYKIRIAKEDLGKFPFEINALRPLLSMMLKREVQVLFE